MTITATELKMNLGKYLELSEKEDIFIAKNGKIISKLSNPYEDKRKTAESLIGILPSDVSLDESRNERLSKI